MPGLMGVGWGCVGHVILLLCETLWFRGVWCSQAGGFKLSKKLLLLIQWEEFSPHKYRTRAG